jgi:hypothetical protein
MVSRAGRPARNSITYTLQLRTAQENARVAWVGRGRAASAGLECRSESALKVPLPGNGYRPGECACQGEIAMDHIHTGILLSEPQYRSCAWKLAFRIFRDPIQLIIAMRDRLTTDFRQNGLDFWTNDLRIYFKLLGESRDRIDQSLAILDTVAAFKTWDAGHRIRTAMSPVYTNLSLVESIFRNPADSPLVKAGIIRYPSFTAAELHSRLLDIRGRVFESSKKFCERPLLEELRRAMAEENHIELGVDRLNPREPKIVVPAVKDTYGDRADDDGHVEPVQADGTDVDDTSEKGMSPEEANEKGKMLVKELGKAFFMMSKRGQARQIGCHI